MNRRISVIPLALLVLAGCSTDTIAPLKSPPPLSLDKSSDESGNRGQYLVLMNGSSIDAGFDGRVKSLGGQVRRRHDAVGFAAVSGLTDATAAQLLTAPGVSEVIPDVQISLDLPGARAEADAAALPTAITPGQADPTLAFYYAFQWNMRLIRANEAWAAGKVGKPRVTVAILDTGIDYDAYDLNGLVDLSRSHSFMNGPTTLGPPPALPSDSVVTATYFPSRNPISDYHGHGTNVATQVSSKAVVFAGVTSRTTLIGVKVIGWNGVGTIGTVLSGVIWAADHGADVANMSIGGGFPRTGNQDLIRIIRRVFDYAKRKQMLIVVAAGNAGQDLDNNGDTYSTYCDAPHVICVSAVGPVLGNSDPDRPAFYTNFGRRSIDVAAPGGNLDPPPNGTESEWPWGPDVASWVWSLCSKTLIAGWPPNTAAALPCYAGNFAYVAIGTSQAAPHVAGLAALLMAVTGESNSSEIKRLILDSADDLGPRGRDAYYGEGRINVARALRYQHRRDNDHIGYDNHRDYNDRDWKNGDRH